MAQHRLALLLAACALAAVAYLPASSALGASRSHRAGHRLAAHHGARKHRPRCAASGGRQRGPRRHARRASYRTGAPAPLLRRPARCPRQHRTSRRRQRGSPHRRVHRLAGRKRPRHGPAAAHSSACVDANLAPTAADLDRIRAATLCLVNRERAGQGESALTDNPHLACAAQAHSEDMASADYFEHVGPHGDTPVTRVRACGYLASRDVGYEIGENIAWGTLWLATPRAIVTAWMASPGHRANILNARYRDTAIGVSARPLASLARGQAGAIYTQDFGLIVAG